MNKGRFDGKAEYYGKFRPSYPIEVIELLQKECNLNSDSIVADIGAGTGIFASLISNFCKHIFAVEPNKDMAGLITKKENLTVINETAEETSLVKESVDIITAAQAFHWFDKEPTKKEFTRILKRNGYLALIWNTRNQNSPFEKAYNEICNRYKDSYLKENDRRDLDGDKFAFFKNGTCKKHIVPNNYALSFEQVCGRLLSTSYIPKRESAEFKKIKRELETLFDDCNENGKVSITMNTEVYIGTMS